MFFLVGCWRGDLRKLLYQSDEKRWYNKLVTIGNTQKTTKRRKTARVRVNEVQIDLPEET
jgi:hypothetical protein